jgi:hypothetical protein
MVHLLAGFLTIWFSGIGGLQAYGLYLKSKYAQLGAIIYREGRVSNGPYGAG